MEEGERCVKTTLQSTLVSTINSLVQATSELECKGSSVYTLSLFRCFEDHKAIPRSFFEQSFVYSCLTAVVKSKSGPAIYKPDPLCERYRRESMQHIPPVDFNFNYLGQIINSLAKRYLTAIKNSFVMHLRDRQLRAIRLHVKRHHPNVTKSTSSFLINYMVCKIRREPPMSEPEAVRYKDGVAGIELMKSSGVHVQFIEDHMVRYQPGTMTLDDYYGYFSDDNLEKHTNLFFGYMVFLYEQILATYTDPRKKPFLILPQYGMKTRAITIGKEQLTGIVQWLAHKGKLGTPEIPFPFLPGDISSLSEFLSSKIERTVGKMNQNKRLLEHPDPASSNKRHKSDLTSGCEVSEADGRSCKTPRYTTKASG